MKKIILKVACKFLFILTSIVLSLAAQASGNAAGIDSISSSSYRGQMPDRMHAAVGRQGDAEQRHEALLTQVSKRGFVPVIVRLKVQNHPETTLKSDELQRHRKSVSFAQDRVIGRLSAKSRGGKKPQVIKRYSRIPAFAMQADALDLVDLFEDPDVLDVVEDVPYPPTLAQSVPLIGASSEGAFLGYTGQGQVVAILDTGVQKSHPFLTGKVVSEACYSSNYPTIGVSSLCPGGATSSTANDAGLNCDPNLAGCSHGTHVAGIVAGKGATFSGVAKEANLIAIKVFSRFPSSSCGGSPCVMAYTSDIIKGLERVYALRESFTIAAASLSLGGGRYTSPCDSDPTKLIIDNLRAAGIATVIASGNNGYTDAISSPACISSAISVGSTNKTDVVSYFSNSASFLTLLAPGEGINSSIVGGGFASWSGTSMATPHTAGAWAVLKSSQPDASVDDILDALKDQGIPIRDSASGVITPRIQVDDAMVSLDQGGTANAPMANAATNVTANGFTANWSSLADATSYRLDVATDNTFTNFVSGYEDLDAGAVTSLAVAGLAPRTTYYYRLRALTANGISADSNTRSVTTSAAVPQAPTGLITTNITTNGFTANWSGVSDAAGYRLDVSTSSSFTSYLTGYQNLTLGNITSRTIIRLLPGTTYYYRVRAYNTVGVSQDSAVVSLTTKVPPPATPRTNTATAITANAFNVSWNGVTGATGYRLDVATSSTFTSFVTGYQDLDAGSATNLTVTGLNPGTAYSYRVRAYNAGGVSASSSTRSLVTQPLTPQVAAPTNITTNGFTANWSRVDGATGYRLDVSTSNTFDSYVTGYQNLAAGNGTSRAVTRLASGTTYYYRVRAYNVSGTSGSSDILTATTTVPVPAAPRVNVATAITVIGFSTSWSNVSGATGYRLDVATNSTFTNFVEGYADLDVGSTTTWIVDGLDAGTAYYYRVRAYNRGGTSANSASRSLTTLPLPPQMLGSTGMTTNSFTATWSGVDGATGYRLDVSTSSTFENYVKGYQNLAVGNATSRVITRLTPGTTYYYRVRAYHATGVSVSSTVQVMTTTSL